MLKHTKILYQVSVEYLKTIFVFRKLNKNITILGSARFSSENQYYQIAHRVSQRLAKAGYNILTGGGTGMMEAANKGAKKGGGYSIGCYMKSLPKEPVNDYLDKQIGYHHFSIRKMALTQYSKAIIIFPGGFGTLDELLDLLVSAQTGAISFPIILMGKVFWQPLLDYFKNTLMLEGTIDQKDLNCLLVADSVETVLNVIHN